MSTIAKTWTRTSQIYGQPMLVHEYAFCNETHLLHCHDHPEDTKCFDTNIISTDFSHWQHRISSPERIEHLSDVHICSVADYFVAVGYTEQQMFIAYRSKNGFDWEQTFISNESSNLDRPTQIKYYGGAVIVACAGQFKFSKDAVTWNSVPFRVPYDSFEVIDIAYFKSQFFFLMRKNDVYAVAFTKNGQDIDFYTLAWQAKIKPTSINASDSQIIVTAGEDQPEFATLMVSSTGTGASTWERIKVKMPYRDITNSVATLYDALWFDNEWIIVGNIQEWNNAKTFLLSHEGLVLRCAGDITTTTEFVFDEIDARDLRKLYLANRRIISFGQAWPTSDNCLFEIAI
jgi:hypothetical protein